MTARIIAIALAAALIVAGMVFFGKCMDDQTGGDGD